MHDDILDVVGNTPSDWNSVMSVGAAILMPFVFAKMATALIRKFETPKMRHRRLARSSRPAMILRAFHARRRGRLKPHMQSYLSLRGGF